jgi:hypothetical protein
MIQEERKEEKSLAVANIICKLGFLQAWWWRCVG